MTLTHATYAPNSLEMQAQAIGGRHSATQAEREGIAADVGKLLTAYELQGGRYPLEWLKRHAGMSHGSATNYRNAAHAITHHAPRGIGVSELATLGRLMRQGHSLTEAQRLAGDQKARQEAAQQAGIGVGKVKYPTGLTGEMANSYAALATSLSDAGLPSQDVPEMTVTMTRLAMTNMQPYQLRALELGEAIGTQPEPKKSLLTFYSWLARQPCAISGDQGVEIHHIHVPMAASHPQGRRHVDKSLELLLPLSPRYHQTARNAAHQMKQAEWSWVHFGREDGAIIRAARYLSQWAEEQGLLRGQS